jgi:O-antigen ligase
MKWLILLLCLALILPLAGLLRKHPNYRYVLWISVGFLPFILERLHFYMALDSAAVWTGYVKGAEFSGLDIVALILYFTLPRNEEPLPFRLSMFCYFAATFLSIFHALVPMEVVFYLWQLARMFLVYATVARGSKDLKITWAVMQGMAAGLIFEAIVVVWQRLATTAIQTSGTMESQNLLGLMAHLVILPFFALLLTGKRGWLPPLVILAGAIVDISTASRATIGLVGLGVALVLLISSFARLTSRKKSIWGIGLAAVVLVVPLASASLQERFSTPTTSVSDSDYDERAAYKAAALKMLADHPFGVGANHFAVIGNIAGYYQNAHVGEYFLGRSGNVHNLYYLTAAETGYIGLFFLFICLFRPMTVALRAGRLNIGDDRGDLLVGFGIALLLVYLHSWVEWVMITFSPEYLLAITIGLVAGNAQAVGYWRPKAVGAPQTSPVPLTT